VVSAKWATWAGSVAHPVDRLLPGVGARLGRFPRATGVVLAALQHVPTRRGRAFAFHSVSRPLVRRLEGEFTLHGAEGIELVANLSEVPARSFAASGMWEWNVGALIRETLEPGDVFVDVGANTGFYTVLAAKTVGSEGHVYAIEPAPPTADLLRRNVALNDVADRVTVVEAAAGSESGVATLYGRPEGHDMTSSLIRRPDEEAPATETAVPVRPVADVVEQEHRGSVRLVKIDVEGHEDEAIRGLDPLFAAGLRPTIVVEVHASFNADAAGAIAEFAARHQLSGSLLADDQVELAPRDRRLSLHDLGRPPDLLSVDTDRYNLVLRPG